MIIKKWCAGEIFFTANDVYTDPFMEVDLSVTFTHESGKTLVRPAFWCGENKWCVRFAPTEIGFWEYSTACNNKGDMGLHNIKGQISCEPYDGDLEIYKRGFVKVSENNRYFTYADGTPFYYLGDTHWLMHGEPLDNSNIEGIDSTFKFMVDYRISQGYTVYQSQPLGLVYSDGFKEKDLKTFDSFDKKYKYIAERGLLHTNSQITFATKIGEKAYTPEFLVKMAKMWVARFGAYPVMWTVAQEVDPDHYGHIKDSKWHIVAETLYLNDCYKHPLTGHMCHSGACNPSTTTWGDKYYHSWFGMQPGSFNAEHFEDFYNFRKTKPLVTYEAGYENLWANKYEVYAYAYYAYFSGACGYGYGAHGVWYFNLDTSKWMDYGGYMHWFEGVKQEGAKKLAIAKKFFSAFDWWNIVPHFHNKEYWSAPIKDSIYATLHDHTHFIFEHTSLKSENTLYKVENGTYSLLLFEPEKDIYTDLGIIEVTDNTAYIPKIDDNPYATITILTKKKELFNAPLTIETENRETMLTFKGDKLKLVVNKPCTLSLNDESIAKLDGDYLVAQGKNGMVTVTATSDTEVFEHKFIAVRQDKDKFIDAPETITPICLQGDVFKPQPANARVVPKFTPENYWNQQATMEIVDETGGKSFRAKVVENFGITPICDGDIYIRYIDWLGNVHKPKKFTIEGYGEPSLTLSATATSSDWHEKYDKRGLPQRALSGSTTRFSGWGSSEKCSFENPVSLIVTFKEASYINLIRLYLTDLRYTLKSFDVVVENAGKKTTIAEVRDNKEIVLDFNFEKILVEKIHVICYKGDGEDYARIDQINAYIK